MIYLRSFFVIIVSVLLLGNFQNAMGQQSWSKVKVSSQCAIPLAIDFYSETNGMLLSPAPGGTHTYWTTSEGNDWIDITDSNNAFLLRFDNHVLKALPNGDCFLIGESTMHVSNDFGERWSRTPFVSTALGSYVGPSFTVFILWGGDVPHTRLGVRVSRDTGSTWDFKSDLYHSPAGFVIGDGCMVDSQDCWANVIPYDTSNHASIIHSSDGGVSWLSLYPLDTATHRQVFYASSLYTQSIVHGAPFGTVYILNNGVNYTSTETKRYIDIIYTTNNGATWHADSTFKNQVAKLYNPYGTAIWVVMKDTHTVAFSPDNGKSWTIDSTTFKDENIQFMHWEDSARGYVVTYEDSTINFWKYNSGHGDVRAASRQVQSWYIENNTLWVSGFDQGRYEVSIFSLIGVKLLEMSLVQNTSGNLSFDISGLANGMYIIKVKAVGKPVIVGKLLKLR